MLVAAFFCLFWKFESFLWIAQHSVSLWNAVIIWQRIWSYLKSIWKKLIKCVYSCHKWTINLSTIRDGKLTLNGHKSARKIAHAFEMYCLLTLQKPERITSCADTGPTVRTFLSGKSLRVFTSRCLLPVAVKGSACVFWQLIGVATRSLVVTLLAAC